MIKTRLYSKDNKKVYTILFLMLLISFILFIFMGLLKPLEKSNAIFTDELPVLVIDTNGQDITIVPDRVKNILYPTSYFAPELILPLDIYQIIVMLK